VVTVGNMTIWLSLGVLLTWCGCGPSKPPRTVVTSSAADVSAAEGVADNPPPEREQGDEPEPDPEAEQQQGVRRGGNLVVRSPVDNRTTTAAVGFRRHVEGPVLLGQERTWVGIEVPDFVDLVDETRELTTLDTTQEGYLAVYRDPLGGPSCGSDSESTCKVSVILYAATGKKLWSYDLRKYLARDDNLKVYDVRYQPPYMFFNQTCPKPKNGDRECGRMIALDTRESKLHFKTNGRVSAGPIVLTESAIITAVPSGKGGKLSSLAISDGSPLSTLNLSVVPVALEVDAEGTVTATDATGKTARAQLSPENRLQAAR
jgi:hypothetical protein